MAKNLISDSINEFILEIRYTPDATVLDHRGTWASLISQDMDLEHWRISQNRIDVFDNARKNRAFVGFRNSGFVVHNSPTANYFSDQARKLFKFLFTLDGYNKDPFVTRIGVRVRILTPYSDSFESLVERYVSRYLQLTSKAESVLNATLVDIGGPLNFKDKYGNFNTMSGPMAKKQMEEYFEFEDEDNFPDVGFYIDVDYSLKPNKTVPDKKILELIRTFAQQAWVRFEQIHGLVMEE